MPETPQLPDTTVDPVVSSTPNISDIKNELYSNLQTDMAKARDPYMAAKGEGHNLAPTKDNGLNFQRYYGKKEYTKLGFNPYIDNENYYQQNTSAWDDTINSWTQAGNLFNLGFSTIWGGKSDREEARDYERYANIGTSQRGGVSGFMNNAMLNSGYTIGLLSEIAAEELALGAVEFFSGGGTTPLVAARTAANVSRLGKLGQIGSKITSTVDRIKDLKNIGKAKTFFEGAKSVGQAINPLRGTTEYLSTVGRQYTRSKDTGKIVALSDMAKWQKGFGTFYRDLREINLAMDEAHLESGFVSNGIKDELINKVIQDTGEHPTAEAMDEINKEAKLASDNTFATNSLLIYSTNRLSFGNVFNKYMPRALQKASSNMAGGRVIKNRATKKLDFVEHGGLLGYKTFLNEAKYAASNLKTMPLQTAKFLGKYTRANFGEGAQEYFQEVIQDAETNMAHDRYTGALSGGAWYNALSSDQYMKAYKESMDHFISSEGAEIFASGFVMGGFAGPIAYAQQNAVKHLTKSGQYVVDKDGYQADKSEEEQAKTDLEKNITKFNDMTDARKNFLYDYIEQLRTQGSLKKEMDLKEDNQKDIIDLKDIALVQQLMFADNMGAYDLILDKIKDMSNLSEDELREAFGEQIDEDSNFISNFKDSYEKIIKRAEKVKEMMDNYDKLFPEPPLYGAENSDFEDLIEEQDIRKARYYTKLLAITNQQSLVRTMERMSSIMNGVYEKAPFWNKDKTPPAGEITKIFNYTELSQEVRLLKDEIKSLKGFTSLSPDQRKDLAYKEKIYATLEKFTGKDGVLKGFVNGLKNQQLVNILRKQAEKLRTLETGKSVTYKRGGKSWEGIIEGETIDKKGRPQWMIVKSDGSKVRILKDSDVLQDPGIDVPDIEDTYTEPLKQLFREYLTIIGNRYNNKIDETNFDSAFQDFKDFYTLNEDEKNLSETVSFLMNPEAHYMFVERYNQMVKSKRTNMASEVEAQLKMYQDSKEENDLIQMLAKEYNIYIEADDLEALFKDNIIPDIFHNIDTDVKIRPTSDTYKEINTAIKNWLAETKRVEPEIITEEVVKKTTEEVSEFKEITMDTPIDEYPAELSLLMEEAMSAYNNAIDERENLSDMAKENAKAKTLEEFINNPGAKPRIRKVLEKWNGESLVKPVQSNEKEVINKTIITPDVKENAEEKIQEVIIPEGEVLDTNLVDPNAIDEREIAPTVDILFPDEIKQLLLNKEIRFLMLGETDGQTQQIVKALQKSKKLRSNQGIKDIKMNTQIAIPITVKGKITELVFSYSGFVDIHEAGGQHQMIIDMKLQPKKTNAFPHAVKIGKDTYYASSINHKAWIEGSGKLHKFSLRLIQGSEQVVNQEDIDTKWTSSIQKRFSESTNLEDTLIELQSENTKREIEGKAFLDTEDLHLIYEDFVKKFQGELTPSKLNLQDEYNVKGKLRKFGTAKVSKKYPNGVDFISTGKKTLGQVQFIKTSEIPSVIQNKLTTDMDEKISEQGLEEVTETDKELLKDSTENREALSKDKMDELADKSVSMTASERIQYLKDNRKKRCNQ